MADQRSVIFPVDMDSGGGTELGQGVNLRLTASGGSIEAQGQKAMVASIPVAIASDQSAVPVDSELAAAAAAADTFANPTTAPVLSIGMLWNGTTWDRAKGDATDGALVNLGTNNDVSVTGTVTVDLAGNNDVTTEFAGSTALATMADDDINPDVLPIGAYLMGFDSGNTNWNRVEVDDAGHLQVDILSGAGSSTPTAPVTDTQTAAALAAGASVDVDSSEAASKKLSAIDVWSTVPIKCELHTVDNAVESGRLGIFGATAGVFVQYKPSHRDFVQTGTTAGADNFRVAVTNLSDNLAGDVHVVFHYED